MTRNGRKKTQKTKKEFNSFVFFVSFASFCGHSLSYLDTAFGHAALPFPFQKRKAASKAPIDPPRFQLAGKPMRQGERTRAQSLLHEDQAAFRKMIDVVVVLQADDARLGAERHVTRITDLLDMLDPVGSRLAIDVMISLLT